MSYVKTYINEASIFETMGRIKMLSESILENEPIVFLENPYTGTVMSKRDWMLTFKRLERDDELYRKYGTYKTHCDEGYSPSFDDFIHEFVEVIQLEQYGEWSIKE